MTAPTEKVAEAIWRADPFRMGDPDTWSGDGDQDVYRAIAAAVVASLGFTRETRSYEMAHQDVDGKWRVGQREEYRYAAATDWEVLL